MPVAGHYLMGATCCACTACHCRYEPAVLCAEAAGSGDHMCDCEGDLDDGVLDDRNGVHTSLSSTLLRIRSGMRCTALPCRGLLPPGPSGQFASVMP